MKKYFIHILCIFALLLSLSLLPAPRASAVEDLQVAQGDTQTKISYDLAFPGILPDNPFYKFKVLRDKIQLYLTIDPTKKIETYLLQADKGILATAILVEKNAIPLANETALKAEHKMTLLVEEFRHSGVILSDPLTKKIVTASLKHQEVLHVLIARLPTDKRETLSQVLDFSARNLQTFRELIVEQSK